MSDIGRRAESCQRAEHRRAVLARCADLRGRLMLLRSTQLARRPVCALIRRSGRPGQPHRPQTGRWLSTGTPPPPPPTAHYHALRLDAAAEAALARESGPRRRHLLRAGVTAQRASPARPALKHSIGSRVHGCPAQPQTSPSSARTPGPTPAPPGAHARPAQPAWP